MAGSTRFRAILAYDGTAYQGFQRQRSGMPTVQAAVEAVLAALDAGSESVTVTGAGRTDSGVHALGQVISFDLTWRHGPAALQRALNARLPADIAVSHVARAAPDFHPRFDAVSRTYRYTINNRPVREPLRRLYAWHVSRPLDLPAMARAGRHLLGEQDFATFGRPPQGDNTVREVLRAEWVRQGDLLVFTVEANAFLYRMVRSLVGALRLVGDRRWTEADLKAALAAGDRKRVRLTAPPHGLTLVAVTYPEQGAAASLSPGRHVVEED